MLVSSPDRFATPADMAACRALLRDGSRSFMAASLLLPARIRDPATALYAFCRVADDIVDAHGASATALEGLRTRLDRVYDRRPLPYPADRALCDVVTRFAVPRALLDALLEGFEWDAQGRRYDTFDDLCAYAARVAGTVGAMMAVLMGQRAPAVVARACDLGLAMQLTNIARDVGEDARAGRLYLPRTWLAEAGIDAEAWLARPAYDAALGSVVQRLLAEADRLYAQAEAGIHALPGDCRSGIFAARFIYAAIGDAVARQAYDSVSRRARVPLSGKLVLMTRAMARRWETPRHRLGASGDATRFIVEAVLRTPPPAGVAAPEPVLVRTLGLFERLERAQRQRLAGSAAEGTSR